MLVGAQVRGLRPAIRQKQEQINNQESPINNESPIKDHRINNVGSVFSLPHLINSQTGFVRPAGSVLMV
jgi:hypothetical protein